MSPEGCAKAELRRLEQELRADLRSLDVLRDRIRLFAGPDSEAVAAEPRWAALAVALHGYYGASESALERIARVIEGSVPSGPERHRELLRAMTFDLADIRPAVITEETYRDLARLLSFRHFFRHAYAIDLDGVRLREHAERILNGHARLVAELASFADAIVSGDAAPID